MINEAALCCDWCQKPLCSLLGCHAGDLVVRALSSNGTADMPLVSLRCSGYKCVLLILHSYSYLRLDHFIFVPLTDTGSVIHTWPSKSSAYQRPLPIMHLLDHFHLRRTSSRDTDPLVICTASDLPIWRLVWLLHFSVRDHSQSLPLSQGHTLTHVHCFCRTQSLMPNSFPQHMQNSFQNLKFLIFSLLKLCLTSKWDVHSKLAGWN